MSNYFDNKELFMTPQVNQYGNHMVMTNVSKETKTKYINFDSKFSDDLFTEHTFNNGQNTDNSSGNYGNFNFTLPDRITGVKSIYVENVDFPLLNYNISADFGNNYFQLIYDSVSYNIVLADGNYSISSLIIEINGKIQQKLNLQPVTNLITYIIGRTQFNSVSDHIYTLNFAVDKNGNFDKYNFKSKLGWLLGFRKTSYTLTNTNSKSESNVSFSYPKYYYFAIDEFSTNFQNSFISALPFSQINKYILCKINVNSNIINNTKQGNVLDTIDYNYSTPSNNFNGYLVSGKRTYNGKIDLQKINVKIIDNNGKLVNLQGQDVSFCLKIEYE